MSLVLPSRRPLLVAGVGELVVPVLIAAAGERAVNRHVEFFTAQIRNPNTRAAYARSASRFLAWCETMGLSLPAIRPVHVAAWVEQQGRAPPSVEDSQRQPDLGYSLASAVSGVTLSIIGVAARASTAIKEAEYHPWLAR